MFTACARSVAIFFSFLRIEKDPFVPPHPRHAASRTFFHFCRRVGLFGCFLAPFSEFRWKNVRFEDFGSLPPIRSWKEKSSQSSNQNGRLLLLLLLFQAKTASLSKTYTSNISKRRVCLLLGGVSLAVLAHVILRAFQQKTLAIDVDSNLVSIQKR
jgi:hypothetical protein